MKQIEIQQFKSQCTIRELWEFTEDNLHIKGCPSPMYWTTEREIEKLKQKKNIFLAIGNGVMIGCIIVKGSHIETLCVKKRHRRKGVGESLVKHVELIMKADKRRKNIYVSSFYPFKAKGFYERMGFEIDADDKFERTWHLKKGLKNDR